MVSVVVGVLIVSVVHRNTNLTIHHLILSLALVSSVVGIQVKGVLRCSSTRLCC